MEIKILSDDYLKSDSVFEDFVENRIEEKATSNEFLTLKEIKYFPVYMAKIKSNRKLTKMYLDAFKCMEDIYLHEDREKIMRPDLWYSLILTEFRNEIIINYPKSIKNESDFKNIVMKKFDWENYVYKVLLGAQYIYDNVEGENERERYYKLIIQNLDLYNYIIKYEIFRNDKFLINILDVIDKNGLSNQLKKKIKGREDLGEDERYGRRVIYEFNKSYPVIMSPMLSYEDVEKLFLRYLDMYMR